MEVLSEQMERLSVHEPSAPPSEMGPQSGPQSGPSNGPQSGPQSGQSSSAPSESGTESSRDVVSHRREQRMKQDVLVKISEFNQKGYTTYMECTQDTPLDDLMEQLAFQKEHFIKDQSIQNYKSYINTGVHLVERASESQNYINLYLDGLTDAWDDITTQTELDEVCRELEEKYGPLYTLPPEVRLSVMLIKNIFICRMTNMRIEAANRPAEPEADVIPEAPKRRGRKKKEVV